MRGKYLTLLVLDHLHTDLVSFWLILRLDSDNFDFDNLFYR